MRTVCWGDKCSSSKTREECCSNTLRDEAVIIRDIQIEKFEGSNVYTEKGKENYHVEKWQLGRIETKIS